MLWNIPGGQQKLSISFISFAFVFLKKTWGARDTSIDTLSEYLPITQFPFEARLCSILGKEASYAGRNIYSCWPHLTRRPQIAQP